MRMIRWRSRVLLPLAVALTAATAACSSAPRPVAAPSAAASVPAPAGVLTGKAALAGASGPAKQTCDPTASIAPSGPLPSPGDLPAGSTMARIKARGELVAGVDQNTYLFGYRDPANGQIEGFDIDMIHQVAQAIFGDPDKVRFVVINNANRVQELQQGKVDIVADTMTENCARWQQVDFSTTYFDAHQRVLVEKGSPYTGLPSLGGRKVCAADGADSLQTIADERSHPVPVAAVSFTDCLVMLQQGQVGAVSTDDAILAGLARQDPNVKVVGPDLTQEPYGLAISKKSSDFVGFVNAVLARMRSDGTWTAIYDHWLASTLGAAPAPPVAHYSG